MRRRLLGLLAAIQSHFGVTRIADIGDNLGCMNAMEKGPLRHSGFRGVAPYRQSAPKLVHPNLDRCQFPLGVV
jgi:hypothetical protein